MITIGVNKNTAAAVTEKKDLYSIISKKDNFKIKLDIYKNRENIKISVFDNKQLIYNKLLTKYRTKIYFDNSLIDFILVHTYIYDAAIQLLIVNAIQVFLKNYKNL